MAAIPQAALGYRAGGTALHRRGLLVAARDEFTSWLNLVEPTDDPNLIVPPMNALAAVASDNKDLEGSLRWLTAAETYLSHPAIEPVQVSNNRSQRVKRLTALGRLDEARHESGLAIEVAQRTGSNMLLGIACLNTSNLHLQTQEYTVARRLSDQALELFAAAGNREHMGRAILNRGIAHMEMSALRLAERDYARAQSLLSEVGGSVIQAYGFTELGRLAYRQGDMDRALEMGSKTLELLLGDVSSLDKLEVARVSELFGHVMADFGNRTSALKYLNRSAAYFSQVGYLAAWQRVTGRIASLLTNRTRSGQSVDMRLTQGLEFLTAVLDLTDDIESVDPYTRGHSERVASLACALGRQIGLNADDLRLLAHAGRLHDVGKVAVDAAILTKHGTLTPSEWERIRIHPVIGEEMVRPYGLPTSGLSAIRNHHERWGGGGYPDGISGKAIPLPARILAVADVYDAVTSDRSYRVAMGHGHAMNLIGQMAGRELDPELAAAFCRLHEV